MRLCAGTNDGGGGGGVAAAVGRAVGVDASGVAASVAVAVGAAKERGPASAANQTRADLRLADAAVAAAAAFVPADEGMAGLADAAVAAAAACVPADEAMADGSNAAAAADVALLVLAAAGAAAPAKTPCALQPRIRVVHAQRRVRSLADVQLEQSNFPCLCNVLQQLRCWEHYWRARRL